MIAFIDGDVAYHASMWGAENIDQAKENLKSIISATHEDIFAEDYIIALGGPNNFREEFYSEYKKSPSRVKSRNNKPSFADELKEWFFTTKLYENHRVIAVGYEADDLLRIWSNQAIEAGIDFIVCSIDKDLNCIPGKHVGRGPVYIITEEEADKHYWKQVLMGDSVDNIPGIPNIGTKKADAILESCDNKNKRKAAVIEAYKEHYGANWENYLLCNGRLIHIWRKMNDYFKIPQIKEEL
jgi:5'-3' exonuclease